MLSFRNFDLEEALTVEYYERANTTLLMLFLLEIVGGVLKKCGVCTNNLHF